MFVLLDCVVEIQVDVVKGQIIRNLSPDVLEVCLCAVRVVIIVFSLFSPPV